MNRVNREGRFQWNPGFTSFTFLGLGFNIIFVDGKWDYVVYFIWELPLNLGVGLTVFTWYGFGSLGTGIYFNQELGSSHETQVKTSPSLSLPSGSVIEGKFGYALST